MSNLNDYPLSMEHRIKYGYDASTTNADGSWRERTWYKFEKTAEERRETAELYFRAAVAATQRTAKERPWDAERISIGIAACNVAAQMSGDSK